MSRDTFITHEKRYEIVVNKLRNFRPKASTDFETVAENATKYASIMEEAFEALYDLYTDTWEVTKKMKYDVEIFASALNIYRLIYGNVVSISSEQVSTGKPINIKVDLLPNSDDNMTYVTITDLEGDKNEPNEI